MDLSKRSACDIERKFFLFCIKTFPEKERERTVYSEQEIVYFYDEGNCKRMIKYNMDVELTYAKEYLYKTGCILNNTTMKI